MAKRKKSRSSSGRRRSGNRSRSHARPQSRSHPKSSSRSLSRGVKWKKLRHNGPLFPDPYKRLPKNVGLFYKGRFQGLSKKAEEAATFFAKTMHTADTRKKKFQSNFFHDWTAVMKPNERQRIKQLRHCDFQDIRDYLMERPKRKKRKKSDRSKTKQEKLKEKYGFCYVDGRKQPVGNYKIEPPALFKGRGNNMLMGKIKPRIEPKDVIINMGRGVKVPRPSVPGQWQKVVHDQQGVWLAAWKDSITNKMKYIYTSPASDISVENVIEKFENARELSDCIEDIRRTYMRGVGSSSDLIQQRSLALYLIDRLCLRIGNETAEESSQTFGCCSLQRHHLILTRSGARSRLRLKFSGKDSIAFDRTEDIPAKVYKGLQNCVKNKGRTDLIFDLITPAELNDHLNDIMPNLTSRVFRTHNASTLFEEKIDEETDDSMSLEEKLLALDKAYVKVAELCNHKKTIPKTHKKAIQKIKKKVRILEKNIDSVDHEIRRLRRESGKRTFLERKEKKMKNLEKRLLKMQITIKRKEMTKDWNLQTGKLNYIDPRITVAWGQHFDVPVEKIFTKTLRTKFSWAIEETRSDFEF